MLDVAAAAAAKSLQSCPTLCNPKDGSPPGSSIHEIFQARVLEWGAIVFSDARYYPIIIPCDSLVNKTDKDIYLQGPYVLAVEWRCSYNKHNT